MARKVFTSLVDGGYLSFILGSRGVPSLWNLVRGEFRHALVCMDHRSFRRDIYSDYKSRRAVNRWADDHKQRTYELVREFRQQMELDPTIMASKLRGAESDDLVAAYYLADRRLPIMGVDKDLQGVPGMYNNLGDYYGAKPKDFWERMPGYISKSVRCKDAANVVLVQTLFGDKSDSIPRLLPSRSPAKVWEELYIPNDLEASFTNFSDFYGDEFFLNVNMVLLPGTYLRNKGMMRKEELFLALARGEYWDPNEFSKLREEAMAFDESRFEEEWKEFA